MGDKLSDCILKIGQLNDNLLLVAYGVSKTTSKEAIEAALMVIHENMEKTINEMISIMDERE